MAKDNAETVSKVEERSKRTQPTLTKFSEMFSPVEQVNKSSAEQPAIQESKPEVTPPAALEVTPLVFVPQKRETKSLSRNILFKPSIHKAATEKCKQMGISLNETINQLLERFVED